MKVREKCNTVCYSDDIFCSSLNIEDASRSINMGKSPGMDGIIPEQLRFAGPCISKPLSCMFSCMFIDDLIPQNIMNCIVVPILKSKIHSITTKCYYRPVALSTIISKVLQQIIFEQIKRYLMTTDNQ